LAERGAAVAGVARDGPRLADLAAELERRGRPGAVYVADVASRPAMARVVDDALARWGRLDVLVNNAGVGQGAGLLDLADADWEEVLRVNLQGPFIASQLAARPMVARGAGAIVHVASAAARYGSTRPNYSASKAGLLGLTRSMARELGPLGVRVNAVLPGAVATDILAFWSAERLEATRQATPLRRLGTPEDVARAIAFLASDDAAFITGAALDVNGGYVMTP
jgi:3-oxoacyl-[acyl-carrier protein] reductase